MANFDDLIALEKGSPFVLVYNDVCKLFEGDTVSALLISRFFSLHDVYKQSGQIADGDWFFQSVATLRDELGLTDHQQRSAISRMAKLGYIEYQNMGSPPRRFIHIQTDLFISDVIRIRDERVGGLTDANQKAFYEKLNSAWTAKEFKVALDKIPEDIGEFMYAWTHAYSHLRSRLAPTADPLWKWNPRDFGILKQYWTATYRKIRPFDYKRLEKYFLKKYEGGDVQVYDFVKFDKGLADNAYVTGLSDQHHPH